MTDPSHVTMSPEEFQSLEIKALTSTLYPPKKYREGQKWKFITGGKLWVLCEVVRDKTGLMFHRREITVVEPEESDD